jgi:hypothetical protein
MMREEREKKEGELRRMRGAVKIILGLRERLPVDEEIMVIVAQAQTLSPSDLEIPLNTLKATAIFCMEGPPEHLTETELTATYEHRTVNGAIGVTGTLLLTVLSMLHSLHVKIALVLGDTVRKSRVACCWFLRGGKFYSYYYCVITGDLIVKNYNDTCAAVYVSMKLPSHILLM